MNRHIPSIPPWSPAQRHLFRISANVGRSVRRLATGLRVATGAQDPAVLTISERLRARIRTLDEARRSLNEGVSVVHAAQAALCDVALLLTRMRQLALRAGDAGAAGATAELGAISRHFRSLYAEIARISRNTLWDDMLQPQPQRPCGAPPADGAAGADTGALLPLLGLDEAPLDGADGPRRALAQLDHADGQILGLGAGLGAVRQRLGATIAALCTQFEPADAESLPEALAARELRDDILERPAVARAAQARLAPHAALWLLGDATPNAR